MFANKRCTIKLFEPAPVSTMLSSLSYTQKPKLCLQSCVQTTYIAAYTQTGGTQTLQSLP